jgi:hypothetical protein
MGVGHRGPFALLSDGPAAENAYREAIDRLGREWVRAVIAFCMTWLLVRAAAPGAFGSLDGLDQRVANRVGAASTISHG